jgi:N-acetyl-anhydromuramyl-L-alanine amidase AmpD
MYFGAFLSAFFLPQGALKFPDLVMMVPPVVTQEPKGESDPCYVVRHIRVGRGPLRTQAVDTLVLHSSFNSLGGDPYDVDAVIAMYAREKVGTNYLLARDGCIYELVPPERVSYHAGVSQMPGGRTGVNAFSEGIEIVNMYDDRPTEAQYQSLRWLIKRLKKQFPIRYIVAHGEIASNRRTDPWNLDWTRIQDLRDSPQ